MSNDLFKDVLLPRVVFLPYLVAKFVFLLIEIVHRLFISRPSSDTESGLCIEAGVKGWESIEFKELYRSACEYLGTENVHQLIIQPGEDYVRQVAHALGTNRITHYLYDPRTGSQRPWLGLWQSLRIAVLLQNHNVVPIVLLTDLAVRNWRSQSAVVSARRGVVVCFMAVRRVGAIFPHNRLIGPSLMPFSVQTKQLLDTLIDKRPENAPPKTIFTGSLYEPRTTILERVRSGLAARGFVFEMKGRVMGSARVPDAAYWSRLCHSDIVFTTADQMIQNATDWTHIPHLVYRYLEVLVSGSLLVAPDVPSVRRYFTPGEHFAAYDSPEDAIEMIAHYAENKGDRLRIAQNGKSRADALISARCFWLSIDTSLASDSLT